MSRLLASIPRILSRVAGPLVFYDAVLTRYAAPSVSPARDSWNPATPVGTDYACKALFEEYEERLRLGGSVKSNERKTLILADTLSVTPIATDKITITALGESAVCMRVATDPARACWELHSEWTRSGIG